jgi:uncharacterized membrane protein YfcA
MLLVARLFMTPRLPAQNYRALLALTGMVAVISYAMWLEAVVPTERPLWTLLAIFAASLVASIAGFAFSAICGAMLFHLIEDPLRVIQIMMICSVAGQSLMVWSLRRQIRWRALSVFLAGAATGLPVGIYILLNTRPTLYVQVVGVFLVLYAFFMIARRPMVIRGQSKLLDAVVGFVGGATGGMAALPGAPVTIWCSVKGWSKEKQRALYQPFILIVQVGAIVVMTVPGIMPEGRSTFDFSGVTYLPAMFLGATFGMALFTRLSDRQFSSAVTLLLIVSGLSLLI